MPRHCSVFGCRSNYDPREDHVSTFILPKENSLRAQWIKRIPTDLSKLKNPIVCIKHFQEDDVIKEDSIIVNGERKIFPRKIPKLKENAVPCIFPNTPSYLSTAKNASRRLIDVEKDNMETAIESSLKSHKEYLKKDSITCLKDIEKYCYEKFKIGEKWVFLKHTTSKFLLCHLLVKDNFPTVVANISVFDNLKYEVYIGKLRMTKLPTGKKDILQSFNFLEELINFVEQESTSGTVNKNFDEDVINSSVEFIKLHSKFSESDALDFIIEQLKICEIPKNNIRYQNKTMLFSAVLYVHSPSAYQALQKCGFLRIPHPRNLRKLICNFSIKGHGIESSMLYLKDRMKYLHKDELLVCINLDEIYIQPNINFKDGRIYGASTSDPQKAAKTAQVFMISSVFSKYRDVVCIIPVLSLTGAQLYEMILTVIKDVEKLGFKVLALISDNNSVNRKAFELFMPDKILKPSIAHPVDPCRLLFFIFDTVHILKCIRNNWESKKDPERIMCYPDLDSIDTFSVAHYKYLETMYEIEKNSVVKFGHLLSYKVLYPSSIQKQNVNLALKLFNEKNVIALKHVARNNSCLFPNVEGTINFLDIFVKWWKIVNVKSVYEGKRFNDVNREAIIPGDNLQVEYLKKFCLWLKKWKLHVHSSSALSPQTFHSLTHTTEAFLELIPYVFKNYDKSYILLSKFQNDNLESRFGMYRQLSGSNYYISYTQLLENEKKLRFKNTVMLSGKHLDIPLRTMIPSQGEISNSVNINNFCDVLNEIFDFDSIPTDVLSLLIYIGGFTVYRVLKKNNCSMCVLWLQSGKEIDLKEFSDEALEYTMDLDRGKLILPTKNVVVSVAVVWHSMRKITENYFSTFMKDNHQLSILHKISCILLSRESDKIPFKYTCLCNETLQVKLEHTALIASKIIMNNFVKSLNDKYTYKENDARKIKKLRK